MLPAILIEDVCTSASVNVKTLPARTKVGACEKQMLAPTRVCSSECALPLIVHIFVHGTRGGALGISTSRRTQMRGALGSAFVC